MRLQNKVKQSVYQHLDNHISRFKVKSCLDCIPNCGRCCIISDTEATVLEFLPAAYELYLAGENEIILKNLEHQTDSICVFYNPFGRNGFCSNFVHRGLVCRLFGFSTRTDKYGNRILVTCNEIKRTIQSDSLGQYINRAPEMSSYYLRLYSTDPILSIQYFPVNESIRKALNNTMLDFQYRIIRA